MPHRCNNEQRGICFTWLEHPDQAQRPMDRQVQSVCPALQDGFARSLNPLHETMIAGFPMEYLLSAYPRD